MNRNSNPFEQLKQIIVWSWTLAILVPGILLLLLGIGAIAIPIFDPLTIVTLLIWIFIISGIAKIIYGILSLEAGGFLGKLLDGIFDLLLAILIVTRISTGILSLTLLVGISILISGVLAVIRAFQVRPASRWGWFLFNGIFRITLGIIISSEWSSNPEGLIGKVFGLFFLASGLSLIILSLTLRSRSE